MKFVLQQHRKKIKTKQEKVCVLIIESDPLDRNVMTEVLTNYGYTTCVPAPPESIFETIRKQGVDIVISQTPSPSFDSFQLLKTIRNDAKLAKIIFIFISETNNSEDFRRGMMAGADDFLNKPYFIEDLLRTIHTRLICKTPNDPKKVHQLDGLINGTLPHQMRSPITMVIGAAHILHEKAKHIDDKDIKQLATMLEHSGNELNRITENFLMLMQLDLLKYDQERLDAVKHAQFHCLPDIINTVCCATAEKHQREKDLTIIDEATSVDIWFSAAELEKILEEVVDNAFKFSHSPEPVTVTVKNSRKHLTIIIEDQGRGISEDEMANIGAFTQFGRKFYEQQGLGLGLAIAQKIVTLYGASINFTHNRKTGAKVTIRIRSATTSLKASA